MQKKIYPLFLVQCSLALCLALGFLISCDSGGGGSDTQSSSSSQFTPMSNGGDARVTINISHDFIGKRLILGGSVELQPVAGVADPLRISNIEAKLYNMDNNTSTTLPLRNNDFEDLIISLDMAEFNFNCNLSGYNYQIYVIVTLNDGGSRQGSLSAPFTKTLDDCGDYNLTYDVSPPGGGSVTLNPPGGRYKSGTSVTLTAEPSSGYAFSNWTNNDGSIAGSNKILTHTMTTAHKYFKANFTQNHTLTKDLNASKKYNDGERILDAITFYATGSGSFVAIGSNTIIEEFVQPDGSSARMMEEDVSPSGSLTTAQFIPALSSSVPEYDYMNGRYFIVKTSANSSWGPGWYLLSAKPGDGCYVTSGNPKCVVVTVWKY